MALIELTAGVLLVFVVFFLEAANTRRRLTTLENKLFSGDENGKKEE